MLPIIPEWEQVSFNQVQDSFNPQPERESFLVSTLLLVVSKYVHIQRNKSKT